ncbi:MAG: cytochrome c oxidase assembly protein [Gemmatimonas sp.]
MRARGCLAAALVVAVPEVAHAHGIAGSGPESELWISAGLGASLLLYALGLSRLWRSAGTGRGISLRQAVLFVAGWAVLAGALLSPLGAASGESFAAHMIEHELLMAVAAPVLVLSRPLGAMIWAFRANARRGLGALARNRAVATVWQAMLKPGPAWGIHAAALWGWHAPALFGAALVDPWTHAAQHASFLAAALIYWWSLFRPAERRHAGIAVLSLFGTSIQTTLLGALLAVSTAPWYAVYRDGRGAFGLTPLEDQQLAGLVMWIPAGTVYMGAALALIYGALQGAARPSGGVHVART